VRTRKYALIVRKRGTIERAAGGCILNSCQSCGNRSKKEAEAIHSKMEERGRKKRQREITSGKRESQYLSALERTQTKRGDHEAVTGEMTHSDSSEFDMDQMRWLYTQLPLMLQGKKAKDLWYCY
jgi:DNA-directed RNA polymerase subunit M/transcription elongation factor TFIIS